MASITKRGNTYRITVCNGRKADGTQIRATATFVPDPAKTEHQNQKALDRFVYEFEERVRNGKYLKGEKMTYKEFSSMWMEEHVRRQLSPTTYERNEIALRTIIVPAIGHLKLAQITPLHLQTLYRDMSEKGYEKHGKHKEYSNNTIKRVHQVISSSLNSAVLWQLIESNPCTRVKPPKVERSRKIRYFTLEQTEAFFGQLEQPYTVAHGGRRRRDGSESQKHYDTKTVPTKYKVLFYVTLFAGFRRGELVALTWEDVDFRNNTIDISKACARTKGGMITKTPKSYTSNRLVTLPSEVMEMLRTWKTEQEAYSISLGSYWKEEGYVFTQDDGRQLDISTPNKVFKKIIRRYNETHEDQLPEITLHGLRHTNATLMIANKVNMKTVSSRLGHSEIGTTMNIYAHALRSADQETADTLGALFFKHPGDTGESDGEQDIQP